MMRKIPAGVKLPADLNVTEANFCFTDMNRDGQGDLVIAIRDANHKRAPRQLIYFRSGAGYTLAADLGNCFQIVYHKLSNGEGQLETWNQGQPFAFIRTLYQIGGEKLVAARSQSYPVSPNLYEECYIAEPQR